MGSNNGELMKKIKILQFPIADSYGGITHYALENWKWMDKKSFHCDFATMSKELHFENELVATGSKIHHISCYAEENKGQFEKEFNAILDEGYDVVHLHTKQWKGFTAEQICIKRNISKVIVHSHSTRCDANDAIVRMRETKNHYLMRKMFSQELATDFWACSKEAADWLFGDKIPKEKIHIMKNAIDVRKFAFDAETRNKLRKEYGLEDKYVVGNVGRLVYQKNQNFLIDAFARAYKERKDIVLILIGDGGLRNGLAAQAKEAGIENAVYFLGRQENVNELYQMMDLFVLPSNFEGLPISLIEAQAAGLNCLCSDTVSRDSDINGNIKFIPLDIENWSKEIINQTVCSEREALFQLVADRGYDIRTQIKEVEKMYIT